MSLAIEATRSSPRVVFDPENRVLEITGESYPENSFEFFAPLFAWLRDELPRYDEVTVGVHITYMNSSSTKCMLDILDILCDRVHGGSSIQVKWYYDEGNERAYELAEEFREDLDMPFDIIAIEPEDTL